MKSENLDPSPVKSENSDPSPVKFPGSTYPHPSPMSCPLASALNREPSSGLLIVSVAEAEALRWAAEYAVQCNWKQVEWETDAKEVEKVVCSREDPTCWYAYNSICSIRKCFIDQSWYLSWKNRKLNAVADAVAKLSLSVNGVFVFDEFSFHSVPRCILDVLLAEQAFAAVNSSFGVSFCAIADHFPRELLELIFKRLPLIDTVRVRAVCHSWNLAMTSCPVPGTVWLLFRRDDIQLPPRSSQWPIVSRLILSSDPSRNKDYTVIVMHWDYREGLRISFYKRGEVNTWTVNSTCRLENFCEEDM
ncbi:hypothetical protein FNV43_RR02233 [Rhamnella rubrinervis]|uniref:F-box domain-containing protein n=1 Tax=Rhamnella rubrinervis TaxID=2594499 RepID=A0A8K0HTC9_9ROSA|nr:hypothetical protein FNV43_RR02233 [Rhamnella rubrinervis]